MPLIIKIFKVCKLSFLCLKRIINTILCSICISCNVSQVLSLISSMLRASISDFISLISHSSTSIIFNQSQSQCINCQQILNFTPHFHQLTLNHSFSVLCFDLLLVSRFYYDLCFDATQIVTKNCNNMFLNIEIT